MPPMARLQVGVVDLGPGAVGPNLGQHAIDERREVRVGLADGHAVGLRAEGGSGGELGVGVLGSQAEKDRVIGADRVDLSLLQHHQAVGGVFDGPELYVLWHARSDEVLERCRSRRGADPLSAKILRPRDRGVGGNQDPLPGLVVHGREIDQLRPGAVDRHRLGHHVDLALLHGLHPISVGDDDEVDVLRVGRSEDGVADLSQHVDVESRSCPVTGSR